MLIAQAHDFQGPRTQQAMTDEMYVLNLHDTKFKNLILCSKRLIQNLLTLTETARRLPTHLPLEIIQYVENSRNPDIYTREFVELVMRYNQQQKGRSEAFASFRDILGQQMATGIPDIKDDVIRVVEASGGHLSA